MGGKKTPSEASRQTLNLEVIKLAVGAFHEALENK
jgi:hypothetical protein